MKIGEQNMGRIVQYHYKKSGDTSRCRCGKEMIYLYSSWRCVSAIQEQLAKTDYAIFKKET